MIAEYHAGRRMCDSCGVNHVRFVFEVGMSRPVCGDCWEARQVDNISEIEKAMDREQRWAAGQNLIEACKTVVTAWNDAFTPDNFCDELIYGAFCESGGVQPIVDALAKLGIKV